MIITPACTDKYQTPYVNVTEDYDKIKNILYNCVRGNRHDGFIECHLAEGCWKGNAVLIRLSSIMQIFDMTPPTHEEEDEDKQNDQL